MSTLKSFIRSIFDSKKADANELTESSSFEENPVNDLRILEGHNDIVRVLAKVDDQSDSGEIVLWDVESGRKLLSLVGHKMPVNCCLLVNDGAVLATGSSDRTLRLWNITTGECLLTIANAHESSVQCLASVSDDVFCSGGNDRFLALWSTEGNLIGRIDHLHALLALPHHRILTGSNSPLLYMYRTDTFEFVQVFTYHRDSVRCLARINDAMFASASIDGVVVVWSTESLAPLKKLSYPDQYVNTENNLKFFSFAVSNMIVLAERMLAVCMGKGFKVYDCVTGDCAMDCEKAHESNVLGIECLYGGSRLVTVGTDGAIRLWSSPKPFNFLIGSGPEVWRRKISFHPPKCVGEWRLHVSEVTHITKLTETSFATASRDGSVYIWSDGEMALQNKLEIAGRLFRFSNARLLHLGEVYDAKNYPNEDFDLDERVESDDDGLVTATEDGEDSDMLYSSGFEDADDEMVVSSAETLSTFKRPPYYQYPSEEMFTVASPATPLRSSHKGRRPTSPRRLRLQTTPSKLYNPLSSSSDRASPPSNYSTPLSSSEAVGPMIVTTVDPLTKKKIRIRVPMYVYMFAQNLRDEEKLTQGEVERALLEQGHGSGVVDAVIQRLFLDDGKD